MRRAGLNLVRRAGFGGAVAAVVWGVNEHWKQDNHVMCEQGQAKIPGVIAGKENTLMSCAPISKKAASPEDIDFVIFHGLCPDGFSAAFVAYLALGDACTYVGIGHRAKRLPDNIDGKNIAILDFSFNEATMNELLKRAKSVVVLDHHASAKEALSALPDENKVFEMKQSGVTLAWDFFAPLIVKKGKAASLECPLIFRYVEDSDIWRWSMLHSKEFYAMQELALPVPKFGEVNLGGDGVGDFKHWKAAYEGGEEALGRIISRGTTVLEYQNSVVSRHARSAKVRRLKLAPEHKAILVNATTLPSEIGNELCVRAAKHGIAYAIVARYNPGGKCWSFSLRSLFGDPRGDGVAADVSKIAAKYGGGGHRAAAGMSVRGVSDIEELFLDEPEQSPRL